MITLKRWVEKSKQMLLWQDNFVSESSHKTR